MAWATSAASRNGASRTSQTPPEAPEPPRPRPASSAGSCPPADPDQGHKRGPRQQPLDLGRLSRPADEAGQLRRQIPRHTRSRCHDTSAPGTSREGPGRRFR